MYNCTPLSNSVFSDVMLIAKISHDESIYTMEIGQHYNAGLYSPDPELVDELLPALHLRKGRFFSWLCTCPTSSCHFAGFLACSAWSLLEQTALIRGRCLNYSRKDCVTLLEDGRVDSSGNKRYMLNAW